MHDVTITPEAITNLSEMIGAVNKQRSLFGIHAMRSNSQDDLESLLDESIQVLDRAWEILYALDTALKMAREVQGGRVYADLDGLEFIGGMSGGIVKHKDGRVQVHT